MDDLIKKERCKVFVEHIEKHLDGKEIGIDDVVCIICGKTIDEIWDEETKKSDHFFIQPGVYKEEKVYIDRNGMPFCIKSKSREIW